MEPKDQYEKPGECAVPYVDMTTGQVTQGEAEDPEFTPEEDAWARNVRQGVETKLAALRRQLTPLEPKRKRVAPIPDEIRALDRPELLSQLQLLRSRLSLRYAHMDLTGLSTDDLRQMVATILEPPTEG